MFMKDNMPPEPPCPPEPMTESGERHVSFEIRTIEHLIKRRMMKSGLHPNTRPSHNHGWIIGYLYVNRDHDVYQRDLEEKFNIRRSSVSSLLSGMEQNGLIKREPVSHDARLKRIVLTQEAINQHEMIKNDINNTESVIRNNISDEEISAFFATLDKIKENLMKDERSSADE